MFPLSSRRGDWVGLTLLLAVTCSSVGTVALTNVYPVSSISLRFERASAVATWENIPSLEDLSRIRIRLGTTNGVLVPAIATEQAVTLTVASIQNTNVSAEGIRAISSALVQHLNQQGLFGVWIMPDALDLNPRTGADLRTGGKELRLVIHLAEVAEVRTIARGRRIPELESTNHPGHRRILAGSPLVPRKGTTPGSPIYKFKLDDYLARLNRSSGRNVAAAISGAEATNTVRLEYLVSEDRTWTVFAHISNTGTEASGEWRERLGLLHQQVTGRDDILSIDYVTADFEHSHSAFASYELPLWFPDRLRARIYGSYGRFTSDEVGLAFLDIEGYSWSAGGELSSTVFGVRSGHLGALELPPAFFDITIGARWQGNETENGSFDEETGTDLFLPYLGLNFSGISEKSRFLIGAQVEGNLAEIAGTSDEELTGLGRFGTETEWIAAKWGAAFSFFVDPLFNEEAKPLLHEIALSSRGQFIFDNRRVIPQQAELIGGYYSVRGYPESFDLGDDAFVATGEYRFYLGRMLRPIIKEKYNLGARSRSKAQSQFDNPYRTRSHDALMRPDWDLLLRAFVDGGRTYNNQRRLNEVNRAIMSAGGGVEFQWRRHLNLRLDCAVALKSEKENVADPVDSGDVRVHFAALLAW